MASMTALENPQTTHPEMQVISRFRDALRLALERRLRPFVTSDLALVAVTDPYTNCALDLGKFGFTTAGPDSNRARAYSLLKAAIDKYAPVAQAPPAPVAAAAPAPNVVRKSVLVALDADLVAAIPVINHAIPVVDTAVEVKVWTEFTERPP